MVVQSKKVFSSHVDEVGSDSAAGELHVAYGNGKTAVYSGVPPDVASSVLNSASIGQALHAHIRGRFPHKYLEG